MDNSLIRGARIGIDAGSVRIGIAASDPDGLMAFPVETVQQGDSAIDRLCQIIGEYAAPCVYVGSPMSMSGKETASTALAHTLANHLLLALTERAQTADIFLIDERLSTVSATTHLRESGRNSRSSRSVIDQAAATVILEHALDTEKRTGKRAGQLLGET